MKLENFTGEGAYFMNQNNNSKSAQTARKILGKIYAALLILLAVAVSVTAAFVCTLAFSKTGENTAEIFGYKLYVAEYDIEATDIAAGSLVIIKNTEDDEFYTPEMLENAVVIENAGRIIKNEAFFISLIFSVPLALAFVLVLLFELRKKLVNGARQSELIEFEVKQEEFEEQTA